MLSEIMDELGEVLEVMDELETSGEILSGEDAAESLKESVETVESGTENTLLQDGIIPEEEKNHIYRPFDMKI